MEPDLPCSQIEPPRFHGAGPIVPENIYQNILFSLWLLKLVRNIIKFIYFTMFDTNDLTTHRSNSGFKSFKSLKFSSQCSCTFQVFF